MATSTTQKRIVCFGSKKFILNSINNTCNIETKPAEFEIYKKENPHWDVIEMDVSSLYDTLTKEFYCHVFGFMGNMGGDFFMDCEEVLNILRKRNVPEHDIPDFIKNYKEIEEKYSKY